MISIPVAVHVPSFKWQLDLFWFNHMLTYKNQAKEKVRAIVVKRNFPEEMRCQFLEWPISIPHAMCESILDVAKYPDRVAQIVALPLNIQFGLTQILPQFDDEKIIEVLDCDMFHFRTHPQVDVGDDELYVSDVYENWHLKSLTENRRVIEKYFVNGGDYYNGGFVPIIGKARTFKKIIGEWTRVHYDILKGDWPNDTIKWWAGMYALQAACEINKVKMIGKDYCYIPGFNQLSDEHYVGHYCVDSKFNKRTYPHVEAGNFEHNEFYDRLRLWPGISAAA